ncbi:hypothetical protein Asppvi_005968 [Aspergillus pseudoviridinutans]|uniref:Cytochrome P450 n=1 Tax=Aspergillus pseudoviridinutans TaxID=1517512 RepID=A0A9P3BG14_9EURO|nr:uncharacterized protein Asppvi_005968 [Aspergillus pseudoviridinutans]GIJ87066.1 hypothetical protein Asppvi_005968 [Aspergillus pseudoviridinutans]
MPTGPGWKAHRRLLQDLMTPRFLNNTAAPTKYDRALELVDLWDAKAQLAAGRPFFAAEDIHNTALDAVLSFSFEALYCQDTPLDRPAAFPQTRLPDSIKAILDIMGAFEYTKSSISPCLMWFVVSKTPHVRQALQIKNAFVLRELQRATHRLFRKDSDVDDTCVQSAVDLGRVEIPISLDRPFETSQVEVGTSKRFPGGSCLQPAAIMLGNRTYFNSLFGCNTRRDSAVCSTVPAVDRVALKDTVLLGHPIPKGTSIFLMNKGASFFSPPHEIEDEKHSPSARTAKNKGHHAWDPQTLDVFLPERWLVASDEEAGAPANVLFDPAAGPTMPFGGVPRGCFGRRLAYLEMRLIFTLIVWKFELMKCPKELSGYDAFDGLVHKPKDCYVRLKKTES